MHYVSEITFTMVGDQTDNFKEESRIRPDTLSVKLH